MRIGAFALADAWGELPEASMAVNVIKRWFADRLPITGV
jgi:hypothetical protein